MGGGQGWGKLSRASFQEPVSAPSRCMTGSPPFAPPSLSSSFAWFSQIRKPGFRFAGPDCSFLLPSHIKSHRRVFMHGILCRASPAQAQGSTGFVLPQLHAAAKPLSNLPHAKAAVQSPAVTRPLQPEPGRGDTCIAPTPNTSHPTFGGTWDSHRPGSPPVGRQLGAAPLFP